MCHLKIGQALVGPEGNPRIQGGPTAVRPPKRLPKCTLRMGSASPHVETGPGARAFQSRCQLHRKRESQDSALYFVEPPLSVF
jgi:hypothetical protein